MAAGFTTWYEDTPDVVHDVPETSSDERAHIIGNECWCHPETVVVETATRVQHVKPGC
jgi:hypothetical protein